MTSWRGSGPVLLAALALLGLLAALLGATLPWRVLSWAALLAPLLVILVRLAAR